MSEKTKTVGAAVNAHDPKVRVQAYKAFRLLPDRHECLVLVEDRSFIVFKVVKTFKRKIEGKEELSLGVRSYTIINATDPTDVAVFVNYLGTEFVGAEIDEEEEAE